MQVVVMMCADQMHPDIHREVQQEVEDMVMRLAAVQEDQEEGLVSHRVESVDGRHTESLQAADHNR